MFMKLLRWLKKMDDDEYIIANWNLLEPNLRELCQAVGISPNRMEAKENAIKKN